MIADDVDRSIKLSTSLAMYKTIQKGTVRFAMFGIGSVLYISTSMGISN